MQLFLSQLNILYRRLIWAKRVTVKRKNTLLPSTFIKCDIAVGQISDKWNRNEFPNRDGPAPGDSFILPCRGEILNPQVGRSKINYSRWMYLVPCRVSRTSVQILAVRAVISAKGNQEKTRERVIASECRIFLFPPARSRAFPLFHIQNVV